MSFKRIYITVDKNADTADIMKLASAGADGLFIFDDKAERKDIEPNAAIIKSLKEKIDIPIAVYGGVGRFEDVKKLLYAGAEFVVVNTDSEAGDAAYTEAEKRFPGGRVLSLKDYSSFAAAPDADNISHVFENNDVAVIEKSISPDELTALKKILSDKFEMRGLVSSIPFSEFKKDSAGLVPCIVQDYKTDKVLMLAYMNEESYNKTIETGLMTYYTRSRQRLWTKGEESGHFQYVKSLTIDCDKDTMLAKVHQIGPACHTGNETCFFTELANIGDKEQANPFKVFTDVYNTISDRQINPREGSYTNYLFDQGIDKILKKFGEEATETVIAAKNPDPSEIKYEIADLMYHMMVLMVEKGISWEDITRELADRE
ncbi:MAG: bifunctional phosphoribosyl-AMP cyclohydrolase/phosphoribosyl-ATP diphosphatase HisIE [Eubacterium sp.]|nr:bifunctional phosphoribosyl-AMP cyclohydrolase/phosphoribosyl-ATP diphosphatase HisIE [Eubacterium sp.]